MEKEVKSNILKKLFKVLKISLIVVFSLIIILYASVFIGHKILFKPIIVEEATMEAVGYEDYKFGAKTHPRIDDIEEFIKLYGQQVKRYGEIASQVWFEGVALDYYTILEDVASKEAWLIAPDGESRKIGEEEVSSYIKKRFNFVDGFNLFEGKGIKGFYMGIDKNDLNNYRSFQGTIHLGTYYPILFYTHELFHLVTQLDWEEPEVLVNLNKDERLDDRPARMKRYLIMKQLMDALGEVENQEEHILRAVATFNDYKKNCPEDYEASKLFDKLEGMAYYFEMKTLLYAAYPDKVKSLEDIDRAISSIMSSKPFNPYTEMGVVSEGYTVGGFAGLLLDRIYEERGEDTEIWQKVIAHDPDVSPMDYLASLYEENIPPAEEVNEEDFNKFAKDMEVDVREDIFRFLYNVLYLK